VNNLFRLPPGNVVVWFGVLGGAVAWVCQFLVNLAVSFAQCNAPAGRWQLPVRTLQITLSAAGLAVGLLSTGVALWLYLYTYQFKHVPRMERRGEGSPPPTGRLNFLAVVGLTVNFLAMAIMIMTGVGAPLLSVCRQS
jgi:hypothetical protein